MANLLSNRENHPEPFTPADFMPGAEPSRSEADELVEFAEKVERGEKFDPPPPEVMEAFKLRIEGKR